VRENSQNLKTKVGTINYAAPEVWKTVMETEQKDFAKYSWEVDVWSFGCVLFYMVTDQELFDGDNYQDLEVQLGAVNAECQELIRLAVVVD
jgi:serine/threonine protein kinase